MAATLMEHVEFYIRDVFPNVEFREEPYAQGLRMCQLAAHRMLVLQPTPDGVQISYTEDWACTFVHSTFFQPLAALHRSSLEDWLWEQVFPDLKAQVQQVQKRLGVVCDFPDPRPCDHGHRFAGYGTTNPTDNLFRYFTLFGTTAHPRSFHLFTGGPASGKTTHAMQLAVDAAAEGFETYYVTDELTLAAGHMRLGVTPGYHTNLPLYFRQIKDMAELLPVEDLRSPSGAPVQVLVLDTCAHQSTEKLITQNVDVFVFGNTHKMATRHMAQTKVGILGGRLPLLVKSHALFSNTAVVRIGDGAPLHTHRVMGGFPIQNCQTLATQINSTTELGVVLKSLTRQGHQLVQIEMSAEQFSALGMKVVDGKGVATLNHSSPITLAVNPLFAGTTECVVYFA